MAKCMKNKIMTALCVIILATSADMNAWSFRDFCGHISSGTTTFFATCAVAIGVRTRRQSSHRKTDSVRDEKENISSTKSSLWGGLRSCFVWFKGLFVAKPVTREECARWETPSQEVTNQKPKTTKQQDGWSCSICALVNVIRQMEYQKNGQTISDQAAKQYIQNMKNFIKNQFTNKALNDGDFYISTDIIENVFWKLMRDEKIENSKAKKCLKNIDLGKLVWRTSLEETDVVILDRGVNLLSDENAVTVDRAYMRALDKNSLRGVLFNTTVGAFDQVNSGTHWVASVVKPSSSPGNRFIHMDSAGKSPSFKCFERIVQNKEREVDWTEFAMQQKVRPLQESIRTLVNLVKDGNNDKKASIVEKLLKLKGISSKAAQASLAEHRDFFQRHAVIGDIYSPSTIALYGYKKLLPRIFPKSDEVDFSIPVSELQQLLENKLKIDQYKKMHKKHSE